MNDSLSRRHAIQALATLPLLAVAAGCDKAPSMPAVPAVVKKAGRVVVAVTKKLAKIGPIATDWTELALEIKAIIDGKEETIVAHITKEEADTLRNGGQLVIKGEDGIELPVEYRAK
jgi:hypothetical protein